MYFYQKKRENKASHELVTIYKELLHIHRGGKFCDLAFWF